MPAIGYVLFLFFFIELRTNYPQVHDLAAIYSDGRTVAKLSRNFAFWNARLSET